MCKAWLRSIERLHQVFLLRLGDCERLLPPTQLVLYGDADKVAYHMVVNHALEINAEGGSYAGAGYIYQNGRFRLSKALVHSQVLPN